MISGMSGTKRAAFLMGALAVGVAGLAMLRGGAPRATIASDNAADRWANLPPTLELVATIRDFRAAQERGGHPDFQAFMNHTSRIGLVEDQLDAQGKPVLASTTGRGDILEEFRDGKGRPIPPALHERNRAATDNQPAEEDLGNAAANAVARAKGVRVDAGTPGRALGHDDAPGVLGSPPGPQITSAESFRQWYRDVEGVNRSTNIGLTLRREPGTSMYVFDSAADEPWRSRGGFFPINSDLYGNFAGWDKNYHFTTEVEAQFVYQASENQVFHFSGDDDVWVFIDGRLVLDLGGLHPRREQFLELNRLDWLEDGGLYTMKLFHAERHTTESNFRIATSIKFRSVEPPPVTSLGD